MLPNPDYNESSEAPLSIELLVIRTHPTNRTHLKLNQ